MFRSIYFLSILIGCSSAQQKAVESISAKRLVELQNDGVTVIDIRTKKEYDQGHIPGVVLVDFFSSDFLDQMKKFDRDKPIVIHCASGGRSGKASKMLQEEGFTTIYDYAGGFSDWSSKGMKIE
ncbi:MAG: rhodanese-like domain-containing protein [Ekhidna sp.]